MIERHCQVGTTSSPPVLMTLCIAAIAITNSSMLFSLLPFFAFPLAEACYKENTRTDLLYQVSNCGIEIDWRRSPVRHRLRGSWPETIPKGL